MAKYNLKSERRQSENNGWSMCETVLFFVL
jgi:hypothetical protein